MRNTDSTASSKATGANAFMARTLWAARAAAPQTAVLWITPLTGALIYSRAPVVAVAVGDVLAERLLNVVGDGVNELPQLIIAAGGLDELPERLLDITGDRVDQLPQPVAAGALDGLPQRLVGIGAASAVAAAGAVATALGRTYTLIKIAFAAHGSLV